MHYLTNYYRNLCEQLQDQINILEAQLNEGMVNIPGKGNVFVADDKPQTTAQPPQPTQSAQSTAQQAPKPVIDVDQKAGINFKDFAEPVKDARGNVTGYRIRANMGFDESNRPTVRGFHGQQGEVRIWKPGEGYQVFGTEQKLRDFARTLGHELPRGDLATLMQKGEITIPARQTGLASGPAPAQAISAQSSPTTSKIQNAARTAKAVGGPMVAQIAGEMLAPEVEKIGEKTGIIDALAKGISSIVPNDILAAGSSPAEQERADQKVSERLKNMGIQSGRLRGPMGVNVGG